MTIPVYGTADSPPVITATLPVPVVQDVSSMVSGSTALTPKWALLNLAASATQTSVVAAVTSKHIRVIALYTNCAATATGITFNSAAAAISPLFLQAINSGINMGFNPAGWFQTVAGEALTATTGAGSTTGIMVVYVEVA